MTQAESMTDELIQSLINTPKIIESSKFKKMAPRHFKWVSQSVAYPR